MTTPWRNELQPRTVTHDKTLACLAALDRELSRERRKHDALCTVDHMYAKRLLQRARTLRA